MMKAPKILWAILSTTAALVFLTTAAVVYWQPIPQPPAGKIKVENDATDVSGLAASPSASFSSYDPYFIPQNSIPRVLIPIPASAPK
jgi:hypothetical protein